MFKWYGTLGLFLVVLTELNFFFKIQPFANWYFPIIWFGYLLVIDAIVYKLKKDSLISNRFSEFVGMLVASVIFWEVFEIINYGTSNWHYANLDFTPMQKVIFGILAFSTVLPALFETVELFMTVHLFDKAKLKKKHHITKHFIHSMIGIGIACFVLQFWLPSYAYPLVWLGFFFLLDPINYLHGQPSIIRHLKDRKLAVPFSLLLAGIVVGFFWEFWNYWAIPKWTYTVPFLGFFKIFEMPILGYLGYFPFAFEIYAMYWFIRSLFVHKEHLLAE